MLQVDSCAWNAIWAVITTVTNYKQFEKMIIIPGHFDKSKKTHYSFSTRLEFKVFKKTLGEPYSTFSSNSFI
jgi:hypothetical protein